MNRDEEWAQFLQLEAQYRELKGVFERRGFPVERAPEVRRAEPQKGCLA